MSNTLHQGKCQSRREVLKSRGSFPLSESENAKENAVLEYQLFQLFLRKEYNLLM